MYPLSSQPVASTDRILHYSAYTDQYLQKLLTELEYRIQVIDGTAAPRYTKNGRLIKPVSFPNLRQSYALSAEAIRSILADRNSNTIR